MSFIDKIEVIVWMQIAVIGVLFFIQPTTVRKRLNIIYWLTLIFHAALFKFTSDDVIQDKVLWFYVLGGFLDFSIIFYTCRIKEVSRMVTDIQDISLASIMFNLLGLFLSYTDSEPAAYMTLFALLYSWAIFILIRGEPECDGNIKVDTRLFAFNRHVHKRYLCHNFKQEEK